VLNILQKYACNEGNAQTYKARASLREGSLSLSFLLNPDLLKDSLLFLLAVAAAPRDEGEQRLQTKAIICSSAEPQPTRQDGQVQMHKSGEKKKTKQNKTGHQTLLTSISIYI
jgi:hypothetical protein